MWRSLWSMCYLSYIVSQDDYKTTPIAVRHKTGDITDGFETNNPFHLTTIRLACVFTFESMRYLMEALGILQSYRIRLLLNNSKRDYFVLKWYLSRAHSPGPTVCQRAPGLRPIDPYLALSYFMFYVFVVVMKIKVFFYMLCM